MTDFSKEEPVEIESIDPDEPSFAELLKNDDRIVGNVPHVGDRLSGKIIAMSRETVFVDIHTKTDGMVDKTGLLDEFGHFPYAIGDMLDLYVVSLKDDDIHLSRALSGAGGQEMLREAYENRIPVSGKVESVCKGGFNVQIFKQRAFCPVSQMDTRSISNMEDYIGLSGEFLIIQFTENGKNVVVSRKALILEEQAKLREEFMKNLTKDAIYDGTVVRIMPYGAFIELIPGVEGMVHVSEITWSSHTRVEEALSVGQKVQVMVSDIQQTDKPDQTRLSLSMKQIGENPWHSLNETIHEGDRVSGRVTRLAPFGAFVEIAEGIEGLIHISEMSHTRRINKPEEILQEGETVQVMIKEIDTARQRISLSLKDTEGDPWAGAEIRYAVGSVVDGILDKKDKAGYVFTLEPGVSGFMPRSIASGSDQAGMLESLKPGKVISLCIVEILPDKRRLILCPADDQTQQDWQNHLSDNSSPSLGSLGEKLKAAISSSGSPRPKLNRKLVRKHQNTSCYRPKT
ncbi:MAG: S1 RNA-binding domain-containing protein [Desulfatirhabdiaceae bacterium]